MDASRLLSLAAVLAFVPAVVGLGGLLGGPERNWGALGTGLALLGCLAIAGGGAVDLAVARLSSDASEMEAVFFRVFSDALISAPFYLVGPTLFYAGLLVLTLGLVRSGMAGFYGPGLASMGLFVVGVSRLVGGDPLTLLGHAVLLAGFARIGRLMLAW